VWSRASSLIIDDLGMRKLPHTAAEHLLHHATLRARVNSPDVETDVRLEDAGKRSDGDGRTAARLLVPDVYEEAGEL
jgi:hypothetical protein